MTSLTSLLPSTSALTTFAMASFVLAISPGPGVLYILTRSMVHGRIAGIISAAAMALGNLCNGLLVALGVGALIISSSTLFTVLRYLGAAYLVFLGIRTLLSRDSASAGAAAINESRRRIFVDGLLVAIFNPKTFLFFAALLPQFLHATQFGFGPGAVLVGVFVLIALCTDCAYALAAGWIAPLLQRSDAIADAGRWIGGGLLVVLGVLAAAAGF
jgi:threonine/homoserine/homoserine lactone efflux protein